jgi:hypothetical protein
MSVQKSQHLYRHPDLRSGYLPEGAAQVGIQYTYGQLCIYIKRKSSWNSTCWNQLDRSMITPPSVLSSNSTFPPPSSQCAFIPARKNSSRVQACSLYLHTSLNTAYLETAPSSLYGQFSVKWQGSEQKTKKLWFDFRQGENVFRSPICRDRSVV